MKWEIEEQMKKEGLWEQKKKEGLCGTFVKNEAQKEKSGKTQ